MRIEHSSVTFWSERLAMAAMLSHIFCCGLPFLMGLMTITGALGLGSAFSTWHESLHAYEDAILIFSASMLALGGVSLAIGKMIDCRKQGACSHEPCAPKKRIAGRLYLVACALFVLNFSIIYLAH